MDEVVGPSKRNTHEHGKGVRHLSWEDAATPVRVLAEALTDERVDPLVGIARGFLPALAAAAARRRGCIRCGHPPGR